MYTVSQLIKLIKASYVAHDASKLGELLVSLIEQEPSKWMALLYMENIIPSPLGKNFRSGLGILAEAIQTSLQFEEFQVEHFRDLFLPLLSIHVGLSSIIDRLEKLKVWEKIGARTVFRVSAFLEDQDRISSREMEAESEVDKYFNSEHFLNDNIETIMDNGKSSRLAGYEANCENLQLILSHAIQKYQEDFFGNVEECQSIYEDAEFSKLLALASLWRRYERLWENVIFQGWHPLLVDETTDVNIYFPKEKEEFLRHEIGIVRRQEMLYEIALGGYLPIYKDTAEKIRLLAQSITLPKAGAVWDCNVSMSVLRDCIDVPFGALNAEYEIYRYHYDAIADDVQLGKNPDSISWDMYQKVLYVLRALALAFGIAAEDELQKIEKGDELHRIAVVEKTRLAKIISDSLNVNMIQADLAINAITFSPELKYIEIWDAPLIEVEKDKVLFIPALVKNGSPARAMENIIAQWNPDLFAKRGKILENRLAEFLRDENISVQGPVVFSSSVRRRIECDLVAYWQGFLILIEAKCTKDIFTPAEAFRAQRHIEEAIEQLNFRKREILLNWEGFRLAATRLALPDVPVVPEKIKLIAVTNVLHFTGWKNNEVIVTDEFCFQRFFGEAEIESIMVSNDGHEVVGTVGRIRKHVEPTTSEFFSYLENPPQVELIKECLTLEALPVPIINETDSKIYALYAAYHPEKHRARIASKKLLGRKSRKRERYHRKK